MDKKTLTKIPAIDDFTIWGERLTPERIISTQYGVWSDRAGVAANTKRRDHPAQMQIQGDAGKEG